MKSKTSSKHDYLQNKNIVNKTSAIKTSGCFHAFSYTFKKRH